MTSDNTPRPAEWYDPGEVKPRRIDPNPRCSSCKSDDPVGRAPMFHPRHAFGPCWVKLPGGQVCGCTVDVVPSPPAA